MMVNEFSIFSSFRFLGNAHLLFQCKRVTDRVHLKFEFDERYMKKIDEF